MDAEKIPGKLVPPPAAQQKPRSEQWAKSYQQHHEAERASQDKPKLILCRYDARIRRCGHLAPEGEDNGPEPR